MNLKRLTVLTLIVLLLFAGCSGGGTEAGGELPAENEESVVAETQETKEAPAAENDIAEDMPPDAALEIELPGETPIVQSKSSKPESASSDISDDSTGEAPIEESAEITSYDQLKDTKHFNKHALEHIFYGQVNSKGNATGYHTESIPNKHGKVIEGTETEPDKNGVYEAKITVNGKHKSGNSGKSTFYPKDWDAQTVVDKINEAFANREYVKGSDNVYRGVVDDDFIIEMYLDNNKKIISAFPVMD